MADINWTTTGHPRGTSMQAWVDNPGHSDILLGPDDKWVSLDPWANTGTVLRWEEPERPGPDWHWIPGHWRRYSGKAASPHVEGVIYHDGTEAFPEPGGLAVCEWEPERWEI